MSRSYQPSKGCGSEQQRVRSFSGRKEVGQASQELIGFSDFAFPDSEDHPSSALESPFCCSITKPVAVELFLPKFAVGSRMCSALAIVLMPKASVYKDDPSLGRKYEIRASRQGCSMQPEPVAHPMNHAPHDTLRLSIAAGNPRH
jgi:hypothetical protein